LEGSIFVAGAVIQWLRDGLNIIASAKESEKLAVSVKDNGGVYFVPALTGLGAPHWDPYARGSIFGITRGTTRAHICRAALESISFQVYDTVAAMVEDAGQLLQEVRVDGGAVSNDFLMQFQADILGTPVIRPKVLETTALGAAYLAGLSVGFWANEDEIRKQWKPDKIFSPQIPREDADKMILKWNKALSRSRNWLE
jgi:glycerol kinase